MYGRALGAPLARSRVLRAAVRPVSRCGFCRGVMRVRRSDACAVLCVCVAFWRFCEPTNPRHERPHAAHRQRRMPRRSAAIARVRLSFGDVQCCAVLLLS